MKLLAVFLFYSLALAGLGNAQNACSSEVGSPFTLPGGSCDNFGSSSGGNSDDGSLLGLYISTMGSAAASDLITRREVREAVESIDIRSGSLKGRQLLNRQSDFSCTVDETCYTTGDVLLCAQDNGDFHDPDGTSGNLNTGHYTLIDGQQGNFYCAVGPTQASSIASEAAATLQATSATKNPNAPLLTSGTSLLTLQTGSSSSSKTTTSASSATPASNGASSSLQSFYITFAMVTTSMIAGSLL